jgi:glutamate/tyrosine decarboxylase-like PLP-dependent enzyme
MAMGEDGFMKGAEKMMEGAKYLKNTINDIPELEIIADPKAVIVAFTTTRESGLHIFHIADALEERGYHMER